VFFCRFSLYFVFRVSLDPFGFVFSKLVLMGLVFLVGLRTSQTIGWEERLRNDLFCVEWDVKPYSTFLSNIQLDHLATAIVTSTLKILRNIG